MQRTVHRAQGGPSGGEDGDEDDDDDEAKRALGRGHYTNASGVDLDDVDEKLLALREAIKDMSWADLQEHCHGKTVVLAAAAREMGNGLFTKDAAAPFEILTILSHGPIHPHRMPRSLRLSANRFQQYSVLSAHDAHAFTGGAANDGLRGPLGSRDRVNAHILSAQTNDGHPCSTIVSSRALTANSEVLLDYGDLFEWNTTGAALESSNGSSSGRAMRSLGPDLNMAMHVTGSQDSTATFGSPAQFTTSQMSALWPGSRSPSNAGRDSDSDDSDSDLFPSSQDSHHAVAGAPSATPTSAAGAGPPLVAVTSAGVSADTHTLNPQHFADLVQLLRAEDVQDRPRMLMQLQGDLDRAYTHFIAQRVDTVLRAQPGLRCPISREAFVDPVFLQTGHTYSRLHIQRHLRGGGTTCPMTNKQLDNVDADCLQTNWNLLHQLNTFLDSFSVDERVVLDAHRAIDGPVNLPPRGEMPDPNATVFSPTAAARQRYELTVHDLYPSYETVNALHNRVCGMGYHVSRDVIRTTLRKARHFLKHPNADLSASLAAVVQQLDECVYGHQTDDEATAAGSSLRPQAGAGGSAAAARHPAAGGGSGGTPAPVEPPCAEATEATVRCIQSRLQAMDVHMPLSEVAGMLSVLQDRLPNANSNVELSLQVVLEHHLEHQEASRTQGLGGGWGGGCGGGGGWGQRFPTHAPPARAPLHRTPPQRRRKRLKQDAIEISDDEESHAALCAGLRNMPTASTHQGPALDRKETPALGCRATFGTTPTNPDRDNHDDDDGAGADDQSLTADARGDPTPRSSGASRDQGASSTKNTPAGAGARAGAAGRVTDCVAHGPDHTGWAPWGALQSLADKTTTKARIDALCRDNGGFHCSFKDKQGVGPKGIKYKILVAYCATDIPGVKCPFQVRMREDPDTRLWSIVPPGDDAKAAQDHTSKHRGTWLMHFNGQQSGAQCAALGSRRPSVKQAKERLMATCSPQTLKAAAAQRGKGQAEFVNDEMETRNHQYSIRTCKAILEEWRRKGAEEDQVHDFGRLPGLLRDICTRLPGSACHAEFLPVDYSGQLAAEHGGSVEADVAHHFVRAFVCLGPTIKYAQIVGLDQVQLDGAWISGPILNGWKQLSVVTTMGSNRILPLCTAITSGESTDNWSWCLRKACDAGLSGVLREREGAAADLCALRDGCASISKAVHDELSVFDANGNVCSSPNQRECCKHLAARLALRCSQQQVAKVMSCFYGAMKTTDKKTCELLCAQIKELAPGAHEWLMKLPAESWAGYTVLDRPGTCTAGLYATAGVECWNAACKPARMHGRILQLVLQTLEYSVHLYQETFSMCEAKLAGEALTAHRFLPDCCVSKWHVTVLNAKLCTVTVRERAKVYSVRCPAVDREVRVRMGEMRMGRDTIVSGRATEHRFDEHCARWSVFNREVAPVDAERLVSMMTEVSRTTGHSATSNLDPGVRAAVVNAQDSDFTVYIEDRWCSCGGWQNVGVPCTHACAVLLELHRQHPEEPLYNAHSHEFATAFYTPKYWTTLLQVVFEGSVSDYVPPRVGDLELDKTCTAPVHRCSEAWRLQCRLDAGEEATIPELQHAIKAVGMDPPIAAGGDHACLLKQCLKQCIDRYYVRQTKCRSVRFQTKGWDKGAYTDCLHKLNRFHFLAPYQCSLCGGQYHSKNNCAEAPTSHVYQDKLRKLNQKCAKMGICFVAGGLPKEASGKEFWPSKAQLECMRMTSKLVEARRVEEQATGLQGDAGPRARMQFHEKLLRAVQGRQGAAVRSVLPGGVVDLLAAECAQPHHRPSGMAPPTQNQDPQRPVSSAIMAVCEPYRSCAPHISHLGLEIMESHNNGGPVRVRRTLTASRDRPGPYTPQGLYLKLCHLMEGGLLGSDADVLCCPAGFSVSYGEGKDINYHCYTAKELSSLYVFGFYHNAPHFETDGIRDLPADIYETKAGMDLRLRSCDAMAIERGMLPGFKIRQLVFGEQVKNGPARRAPPSGLNASPESPSVAAGAPHASGSGRAGGAAAAPATYATVPGRGRGRGGARASRGRGAQASKAGTVGGRGRGAAAAAAVDVASARADDGSGPRNVMPTAVAAEFGALPSALLAAMAASKYGGVGNLMPTATCAAVAGALPFSAVEFMTAANRGIYEPVQPPIPAHRQALGLQGRALAGLLAAMHSERFGLSNEPQPLVPVGAAAQPYQMFQQQQSAMCAAQHGAGAGGVQLVAPAHSHALAFNGSNNMGMLPGGPQRPGPWQTLSAAAQALAHADPATHALPQAPSSAASAIALPQRDTQDHQAKGPC